MNEPIRIPLKNGLNLVCEQNTEPYNKQVFIYLEKDGVFLQDIVHISPEYIINDDGAINYLDDAISLDLFEDPERDYYSTVHRIPIRKED